MTNAYFEDYNHHLPEKGTILFGVLNWGMGHASRSIPIIKRALSKNNRVVICSDGVAMSLLQMEFPQCEFVNMQPYAIKYKFKSMVLNVIFYLPVLIYAYFKERIAIKKLVSAYQPNLIISDNRFGFYDQNVSSVYISHQLSIYHPNKMISHLATFLHQQAMKSFEKIWVPDYANHSLSGLLSTTDNKALSDKTVFIGPLSRFTPKQKKTPNSGLLIILSGPEPSRSILEKELFDILGAAAIPKVTFIRGSNQASNIHFPLDWNKIDMIAAKELQEQLDTHDFVIARAGYSTIMDLVAMKKRAILIPKQGQTEQEYLATHLVQNDSFHFINESDLTSQLKDVILKFQNS